MVGAGLAGLSAPVSCALAGDKVTEFEAAKELAEVGTGLQITPNASRLFREWELYDAIHNVAAEPTLLAVHRVDLQKIIYDKAVSLGVEVKLNSRILSVESTSVAAEVLLQSGESAHFDLVIGADGL